MVCYGERYFEAAHICGVGRQGWLRRSVCLRPDATSARRGAGLAVREKGAVQYGNERLGDDGEEPERHVVEECGRAQLSPRAEIFRRSVVCLFVFVPFLWRSREHARLFVGMTDVGEYLLLRCCKLLYYCNHHGVISVGVWITQRDRDTCVRFLPRQFHSPPGE